MVLLLVVALSTVVLARPPTVLEKINSQSPADIAKTFELLENPFIANALVNSPQNQQAISQGEPQEDTELINYLIQGQKKKPTVEELVHNPLFLAFFEEFNKQYDQQGTASPVVPVVPTTRKPTRRPVGIVNRNPFFTTTTPNPFFSHFVSSTAPPRPLQAFVNVNEAHPFVSRKIHRTTTTPSPFNFPQFFQTKPSTTTKQPTITKTVPLTDSSKSEEALFRHQAETAMYMFASDVDDNINGNLHQREEVRDGLNVKGKYSFSDGYYKRTVHYEADDKGYRVVKEEVEPIGDGPQINPDGHARVSSYVAGNTVNYEITKNDIQKKKNQVAYGGFVDESSQ